MPSAIPIRQEGMSMRKPEMSDICTPVSGWNGVGGARPGGGGGGGGENLSQSKGGGLCVGEKR